MLPFTLPLLIAVSRLQVGVPMVISGASLLVSVLAYRRGARPADLSAMSAESGPSAYALAWYGDKGGRLLMLRLPFVLVNHGARAGAVLDARLEVPEEWAGGAWLELNEFYDNLTMREPLLSGEFAHPIVVAGGGTEMRFAQFKAHLSKGVRPDLRVGRFDLTMYVRTTEQPAWHPFWQFSIEIDRCALEGMGEGNACVHWNPADRGALGARLPHVADA